VYAIELLEEYEDGRRIGRSWKSGVIIQWCKERQGSEVGVTNYADPEASLKFGRANSISRHNMLILSSESLQKLLSLVCFFKCRGTLVYSKKV